MTCSDPARPEDEEKARAAFDLMDEEVLESMIRTMQEMAEDTPRTPTVELKIVPKKRAEKQKK